MSVGCSIAARSPPCKRLPQAVRSVPRARIVLAGYRLDRGHFDEPGQQRSALFEIGRFEQRLLFARRERTRHRDRGDKLLGWGLLDCGPVGRELPLAEEGLEA